MIEDDPRKEAPVYRIGQPLANYSIAELEKLLAALEAERVRITGELEAKRASGAAAEAFFKKS